MPVKRWLHRWSPTDKDARNVSEAEACEVWIYIYMYIPQIVHIHEFSVTDS